MANENPEGQSQFRTAYDIQATSVNMYLMAFQCHALNQEDQFSEMIGCLIYYMLFSYSIDLPGKICPLL